MSTTRDRRAVRSRRARLAGAAGLVCAVLGVPTAASGEGNREEISYYSATVRVNTDGSIHVAESVTYDFSGLAPGTGSQGVQRAITTREHYDAENDRIYELTNVSVDAVQTDTTASVSSDDGTDTIAVQFAQPQQKQVTVTFDYDVQGVARLTPDGLEVRWPVLQGFDAPIADATVQWNAPDVIWLSCLAGAAGSSKPCTTAQLAEVASPTMTQLGLGAGEQMVGILGLSADSGITASADLQPRWSLARGFTATGTPLWVAVAVLLLGLLAALGLWWTRGRDSRSEWAPISPPLVPAADGGVAFAPPSGIRPGQMGTLVDERADIVDVSATIIDLAVRNYLFIEELASGGYGQSDWLLRRRNDPGDELLAYEREVFDALFSAADEVRVSELGDALRDRLPGIQALMYDDMVDQGWFAERPDSVRGRWTTAGWVLLAAGAVLTVVLALVSTFGLVGVALLLAGVALAAAGQLAPARTSSGGRMLSQLRGFRAYLESAGVADIPVPQREELISRFYPYALVFGLDGRWAAELAAIDTDTEPDDPIYWYGARSGWHLSDLAPSLLHLATALSAALASRRLLGV